MRIVREHINEIRQDIDQSGLGALGTGRVAVVRQKYEELNRIMKDCKWDFWHKITGPNILAKESARILNCDTSDIIAVQFDGTCIYTKSKNQFGVETDEYKHKDMFLNFRFLIWDEPNFIISYNSDDWNIYSSKLTMYLNNKIAKFF